jgi:guanylate kinase
MQNIDDLIKNYKPPQEAIELLDSTKAVFLVGISGAGKDTILKELIKTGRFHYIVSHTTREPRENSGVMEQDGKDYHFINLDKAKSMLKNNEFIEAKFYSGNVYGTSLEEFKQAQKEQKTAITDIEVQGVGEYASISKNITPIFVLPPNYEVWQTRLMSRYEGSEIDEEDLRLRKETAKNELEEALSKDYYQFVINDDLTRSTQAIVEITEGSLSDRKNSEAQTVAQRILDNLYA